MGRATGALEGARGYYPGKKFEIAYTKSCNLVHFWPENGSQCRPYCVLKHFNNGNGMVPRVTPRNDPCKKCIKLSMRLRSYRIFLMKRETDAVT